MAEGIVFDADAVSKDIAEGIAAIQQASTMEELKAIKAKYAGANSAMTRASKAIGSLAKNEKKEAGKVMGKLRADFGRAYGTKEASVKAAQEAAELAAETVDMTLPIRRKPLGARHPLPKLMEDVEDFFVGMGWQISDGPEVETEWFDFDALNFGPDHPARQMQDTFYVKGNQSKDAAGFVGSNMVLRTQTSSDQVRGLISHGVPLYIACPGRVFRTDELDATHTPVFHQVEWGGCGMVNPNVLRSAGIDPDIYTGFAFGVGVERTLLLRHDINDMHDLVEGDVRFSEQFVMGE